jgi:hypothetical protein
MAKFEIKTISSFALIYFVEAETEQEAEEMVLTGEVDYVQKHIDELITSTKPLDEDAVFADWLREKNISDFY